MPLTLPLPPFLTNKFIQLVPYLFVFVQQQQRERASEQQATRPSTASSPSTSTTSNPTTTTQEDPKFQIYMEFLKSRGYFEGTTEGSPEWNQRYALARERYYTKHPPPSLSSQTTNIQNSSNVPSSNTNNTNTSTISSTPIVLSLFHLFIFVLFFFLLPSFSAIASVLLSRWLISDMYLI